MVPIRGHGVPGIPREPGKGIMKSQASSELEFIERFLKRVSGYVVEKWEARHLVTVTSKGDPADLLTEVDLTVQKRFADALNQAYPDDVLVAEEGTLNRMPDSPDGRAWVMDPIDGTYNFVRGMRPIFGVSIAFLEGGETQCAGVMFPLDDQCYLAMRNGGAWCNGRPLHVSDIQQLEEACVEIDFSVMEDRQLFMKRASLIMLRAGQIRCCGAAVGGICQVAAGETEAYIHMTLHPWDYAAAQLIAEEAGGMATRLDGSPLRVFDRKQGVLISNGAVHREILAIIRP